MSGNAATARPLGGFDATTVGIGSIVGAGVFIVFPAAVAADGGPLTVPLVIAAVVAYACGVAVFQISAALNEGQANYDDGGTRAARVILGPTAAFVTGWVFLCSRLAASAVAALMVGTYLAPDYAVAVAVAAVAVTAVLNLLGATRSDWVSRFIVAFVIAVLAFVAVVAFNSELPAGNPKLATLPEPGLAGLLESSALLYFAFIGYGYLASLGPHVRSPGRNIPLALPAAIAVVLGLYLVLGHSLLSYFGPARLAAETTPMVVPVADMSGGVGVGVVLIAAAATGLGALSALNSGCARIGAAMAAEGELPAPFGRKRSLLRGRPEIPWVGVVAGAAVVMALVVAFPLSTLLGVAAFTGLLYAGGTAVIAFTLHKRRWYTPRVLNVVGIAGTLLLALSLPLLDISLGLMAVVAGAVVRLTFRRGRGDARGGPVRPPD
ncbi:amino acid permease [Arthrobacter sp. BL-252-APC-1A]|uniref:APC family permease n=1 Tax=Arthrobacter sp. BL-252-APC-1A TaxID=2606622 RepID=UPI0012B3A160|nr:APC family permease [Arthrobacter sp. BL-252-APC-1A]MSS00456.1 amino acid permease [Arthrobacter sp. BL-252-APC-1A]